MTPRELAAAIRKGHTMIVETRKDYYTGDCGCALGAALAGVGVSYGRYDNLVQEMRPRRGLDSCKHAISELLDAPFDLMLAVSMRHVGGESRLAIADWLDTLEPETKPQHKQTFDAFMATVLAPRPELQGLPLESQQ